MIEKDGMGGYYKNAGLFVLGSSSVWETLLEYKDDWRKVYTSIIFVSTLRILSTKRVTSSWFVLHTNSFNYILIMITVMYVY